jgi:carbon monoxide dehydrogenase subunit G
MKADPNAPVYSEGSIVVDATPEQVWDVLADFEDWPTWNTDVDSVSIEGPVATGTVFRWKAGSARLVSTLQEVDRPSRLSWTGRTMGINAMHVWRFERSDNGTTVSMQESFDGLVAKLLKGRLQRDLDRTTEKGLLALKAAAEAKST